MKNLMKTLSIRKRQKMIVMKVKVYLNLEVLSKVPMIKLLFHLELGSEEESGKDWSDLEREAAEADNRDDSAPVAPKNKKSSRDRDRDRDKHKSKNNHR